MPVDNKSINENESDTETIWNEDNALMPIDNESLIENEKTLEADSNKINSIALLSALELMNTDHELFHFDIDSIDLHVETCATKGLTVFQSYFVPGTFVE